jgi:hypothetical protein
VSLSAVMMDDRAPVVHTIDECAVSLHLEGDALDREYRAMVRQTSQVGPMIVLSGEAAFRELIAEEAFTDERT